MKSLLTPLSIVATGGTGLLAGLFLAFATAVMPGLRATSDPDFVHTMQRINVAIVNPLFLLVFLGSPLALAAATALGPERRWAGAGLGLQVAALAVTFAVNIPRNDALATARSADPAAARLAFERSWTLAHDARTALMVASFAACLVSLTKVSGRANG